jgi:hypothetical protein
VTYYSLLFRFRFRFNISFYHLLVNVLLKRYTRLIDPLTPALSRQGRGELRYPSRDGRGEGRVLIYRVYKQTLTKPNSCITFIEFVSPESFRDEKA